MRANGTFSVKAFNPASVTLEPAVTTGLPVGVATMEKQFEGDIAGRSATVFTAAFDQATGVGTYVAMESFEGSVGGRQGAFNFVHSASTTGADRSAGYFAIVPSSGPASSRASPAPGTSWSTRTGRTIWLDYELG